MARRAAGALAAMLALGGIAAPAALFASASPLAAAAPSGVPATVTFTGLSPEWVSPSTRLTATISVKNTGPAAESLAVELFYYSAPITSIDELQQTIAAGNANGRNPILLPGTNWQTPVLRSGATASRSFQVPVTAMKLKRFGVYPLDAQVSNSQGIPLNNTLTYLPYVPAKNGAFSSSVPPARKISLVWPLIDQPLLDQPWQGDCRGRQPAMLAQSLATGGRLRELLETGSASSDAITWAVDPALLANAAALSRCGRREPQWAHAASDWLNELRTATARQPLFLTPYGDPEVATLIAHGHGLDQDVDNAFTSGRIAASQILRRNDLVPGTASTGQGVQAITSAMAWSAGGPTRYSTLEHLGARDNVASLLLSSSELPQQGTVVRTPDGTGRIMNLLLANDSITKLLGSGSAKGSAASTAQEFLAETALLAMQGAAPIIVAPPHRWQPAPGLAPKLLSGIADAPWLSAATLASLTTLAQIPTVQSPTGTAAAGIGAAELRQLLALHNEAIQLQKLEAQPVPNVIFAVSTAESSAYEGRQRATAFSVIGTLKDQITKQLQTGVRILTEGRITLGGTKGNVPVSIDNRLGSAAIVKLQLSYPTTGGTTVTASPSGLVTVRAHTARTVSLRINASKVGATTITMSLLNRDDQPVSGQVVRTTVETTQAGLLGMIIFAAALGVFLVASAVRALRRGPPRPATDGPGNSGPSDDLQSGHSTQEAARDTVVADHGELGTAGTPRPR